MLQAPLRKVALDRHVAGLASGKPHLAQRAAKNIAKMGLSPAEHKYVQIETQKKLNPAAFDKAVHVHPHVAPDYGPMMEASTVAPAEAARRAAAYRSQLVNSANHSPLGSFGGLDLSPVAEGLGSAANIAVVQPWKNLITTGHPFAHGAGKNIDALQNSLAEGLAQLPSSPQEAALWGVPFLRGGRALAEAGLAAKSAEEAGVVGRASAGVKAAEQSYREGKGLVGPALKAPGRAGRVLAERRAAKALVRGPKRTEGQALAHVAERNAKDAAALDRERAKGQRGGPVNLLRPGEVTPETGGTTGQLIRHGLNPDLKAGGKYEKVGARLDDPATLRKEQEALRAPYRSGQASAMARAGEGKSGLNWLESVSAARAGKHPTMQFRGFANLTPELRDEAINFIRDHPRMQIHEKTNAARALSDALAGKVPTVGEQKLLERAFGKEAPNGLIAEAKKNGWGQTINDVLGISRALRSSLDFSGPGRQGIMALAYKPRIFLDQYVPGLKSMGSEKYYQGAMDSIEAMPSHPTAVKAGVAFTDIGESRATGTADIYTREESMPSNYAERLPLIGGKVRASDRGYVGFLNLTRAHLFDYMLHNAAREGYHLTDEAVRDIARVVNAMTGRGDMKWLANHTATLNATLFSPRLLMSRLNFLNPVWYARLSPYARIQAMKAGSRFFGAIGLLLLAVTEAGGEVGFDPRSADFGKIVLPGGTRIDPGAGFNQVIHLYGQFATLQRKSTTTGKITDLTAGGFGQSTLFDVGLQFLENKTNPILSTLISAGKGNQFGQPLDYSFNPLDTNSLISNLYEPMAPQDALSTYQQTHSPLGGLGAGLLSGTGVGVQTYPAAVPANSPAKIQAAVTKAMTDPKNGLLHQEAVLHISPQYRPMYAKATRVQVQRDLAKTQARKVSKTGKITAAESYKITMRTLLKNRLVSPAQYKSAINNTAGMSDREYAHWEYEAWTHLGFGNGWGPGQLLEKLHHAYNLKTG